MLTADEHRRGAEWFDWYRRQLMSGAVACPPPDVTARMVYEHTCGIGTLEHVTRAHAELGAYPQRVAMIDLPDRLTTQQVGDFRKAWLASFAEVKRHAVLEPILTAVRPPAGWRWADSVDPVQWWSPIGRIDHRGPLVPLRRCAASGLMVAPAFVVSLLVATAVLLVLGYRRFGRLCVGDW